jgi:hypothetical protein
MTRRAKLLVVRRARAMRRDRRRPDESTWPGKCDWLSERRLAWLLLHHRERNLNTNDWNEFWPLLFLLL